MCDKRDKIIVINNADWNEPECASIGRSLLATLVKNEDIVYGIVAVERGCDNNKLHLQGFIQSKKKTGIVAWAKLITTITGYYPHVEDRRGSPEDNKSYIAEPSKHNKPPAYATYEIGKLDTDRASYLPFRDLIEHVKTKKVSFNELKKRYTAEYLIHYRQFDRLRQEIQQQEWEDKEFEKEVHYIYGPAGSGKSRKAHAMARAHGNGRFYEWTLEEDGQSYDEQDTIIFDDFRGEVPYATLLRLLDRYPKKVRIKGDTALFNQASLIIFTSDRHWTELYPKETGSSREQLARRITKVHVFGTDGPLA